MKRMVFASALLTLLLVLGPRAYAADKIAAAPGPEVRSAAALVVDGENGEVIFQRKPGLVAPIASITKLMTALVVLDGKQPLDEVIKITAADHWKGKGAFSRIAIGTKLTREDLLRLALMASENLAARTLARNYPGGIPEFVKTMNLKAKVLGMTQSHFDDPSGLSSLNVASARDLVKLINAASRDSRISEYSTARSHDVVINRRVFQYRNTNLLIGKPDWEIVAQKTGYTADAGECLVMKAVITERTVVIVLLNSFGKLTRTADARRIRKWMEAQQNPTLAGAGGLTRK